MAHVVIAYIVMAYMGLAKMAPGVMACVTKLECALGFPIAPLRSYGPCSYGLYSYGPM